MTSTQIRALAAQFRAMADSVEVKRRIDRTADLKFLEQRLLKESSDLEASAILTTLDALEPHYDAMLSVVRDLKDEVSKQARIESITNVVDKALAIAAAFRAGNVGMVISSIDEGVQLVKSVRA